MKHDFRPGRGRYTIGIEEELMILDPQSLDLVDAIERLIDDDDNGAVKPELHECVLEIATRPAADTREAGAELRALRREVRSRAEAHGLTICSAGTHPFARWEDHRISAGERYRDLIDALRFVARQEIIFGLHVHVGIDDPDKAIYVANGMRVHVPILLALSANSPYWRSDATGLASTRVPIFRQFPRIGIPPYYADWADYERRIEFMVETGAIADYTYLWFDVRPHPNLGTVEIRAMDAQTRVEHTLAIAALIQAMVKELAEAFDSGRELRALEHEMLEEDKWLAARHGLFAELIDLPDATRISGFDLARRLHDRLLEHAQDLGSAAELEGIVDLIERGNGAQRQRKVYEANNDFGELVRDLVEASGGGDPGGPPARVDSIADGRHPGPVRRLQELQGRGEPVHHRMPVLRASAAQAGAEARSRDGAPPRARSRGRLRARTSGASARVRRPSRAGAACPTSRSRLVVIPAVVTLLGKAGVIDPLDIVLFAGVGDDWWRPITTHFYYGSTAYEVIALGSIFLFAWLLERRHGWWAPLLVAIIGGAAGIGLVLLVEPNGFATGGNDIALALLAAWAVRDLRAARRGEEIDSDLLGVAAIAVVLALLPAAVEEAHPMAGAGGLVAGLLLGLALSRRG